MRRVRPQFRVAWVLSAVSLLGVTYAGTAHAATGVTPGTWLPLRFDSEVVRLRVGSDSVQVEGLYRFVCTRETKAPFSLLYPYPSDSLMGGAHTLSLEGRAPGALWESLAFSELPGGRAVRWQLPGCAAETLEVRTAYRQALKTTHATYIVTSTRVWGRPLRRARFEIYLPQGAIEPRFSFPFRLQTSRAPDEHAGYVFEAREFMPDRDITVDWTVARVRPGSGH